MCCALGRPVYHINKCLGNGLCEDVSTGWIWRESCTDPTWTDPRCLKLCMEDSKYSRAGALNGKGAGTNNWDICSLSGVGYGRCGADGVRGWKLLLRQRQHHVL